MAVHRQLDTEALRDILIVKLSSIGDVVHALPVASALKRRYPLARITWAIERWTAPLIEAHPAVDRIVAFPPMMRFPEHPRAWWSEWRTAVRALRQGRYDVALDLQGLAKSATVTWLSKAPLRLARAGQREGAHLVSTSVALPTTPMHAVDEYLQVARAVGADSDFVEFGLRPTPAARESIDAQLAGSGIATDQPVIVVNPSAAQTWKHWPDDRWSEVLDRLSDVAALVVIGTEPQAERHQRIVAGPRRPPVDLTGRTTLAEVVALLDRAVLHLAPDTGTVHIAVALGTPVVAVYGPTSRTRVGPYGRPQSAVAHDDLCGRGCPLHCRFDRRCLQAVTVDEVVDKALSCLS